MAGQVPMGNIAFEDIKPAIGIIVLFFRRAGCPGIRRCLYIPRILCKNIRCTRIPGGRKHNRNAFYLQPIFLRRKGYLTRRRHKRIYEFSDDTVFLAKKLHIHTIRKTGEGNIIFRIRLVSLVHRPLFLICFQFKYIRIIVQRRDQPHRGIGDRKAQQYKQHQQPCFSQKA